MSRCMLGGDGANRPFLVVETQKRSRACDYVDSILGSLLKPIDRRRFKAIVERHDGDAYDKSFKSWDHLVALIFAQLSRASSLRGLELASMPTAHHHYHLGVGKLVPLDAVGCERAPSGRRFLRRPSRCWRRWPTGGRGTRAPRWCA